MIVREEHGSVTVLRIDHGKVGAIDVELLEILEARLDEIEGSPTRAVVLTGSGSSFSAGLDLWRILDGGEPYVRRLLAAFRRGIARLFTFPRPVVAAVNGHAIAGGCVLASCCDYRIVAAGKGKIGFPGLRVRMPYPALAVEILGFAAPLVQLEDLLYGGVLYSPSQARANGLVNEVVAPECLQARAREVAERRASAQPLTFRLNKDRQRRPVLELAGRDPAREEGVDRAWSDPEAHALIRAHLEETVGRRR
ncbi:MAG: enoyl-CoA hydratase/isomerase family protein [Gemmatimonadota bacterium]|nr:MAG: enoyl-CoA hydratase/isomerase family protein [Gemmatimonadota bacterium]